MASVKACAPYFYMIVSQFAYAGSSILSKLALGQGLSALVFVVYRHLIAMLILAPLAYVLERNRRPSFSFGVMLKIFILAMLGITIQQNVYYVGLHLISPTVASALGNVIPAFTFLLPIDGNAQLEDCKREGQACRGHLLHHWFPNLHILESPEKGDAWLKGSALMLFGYFACSVSLVLQILLSDSEFAQSHHRWIECSDSLFSCPSKIEMMKMNLLTLSLLALGLLPL
ncbi:WAT1-related protein At5g07050-like [Zingiber officinale]|uniref:WAT1-related protein At5g07050-like n=1 Tax=Zingiber officinale TaxID=94328 RepID=UPI001C4A988A|nr:WAT1-related protein At5g07050-like [Zingiber officinale]